MAQRMHVCCHLTTPTSFLCQCIDLGKHQETFKDLIHNEKNCEQKTCPRKTESQISWSLCCGNNTVICSKCHRLAFRRMFFALSDFDKLGANGQWLWSAACHSGCPKEKTLETTSLAQNEQSCDLWHSLVGALETAHANPCCLLTMAVSSWSCC